MLNSTHRLQFETITMDIQFYASQFHLTHTPRGIQDVSVCWRRSYLSCRLNIFMLNRNIQYPVITFDGARLEHLIRTNNIGYKRNSDWFHSSNCWYISLWTAGVRSLLFCVRRCRRVKGNIEHSILLAKYFRFCSSSLLVFGFSLHYIHKIQ